MHWMIKLEIKLSQRYLSGIVFLIV